MYVLCCDGLGLVQHWCVLLPLPYQLPHLLSISLSSFSLCLPPPSPLSLSLSLSLQATEKLVYSGPKIKGVYKLWYHNVTVSHYMHMISVFEHLIVYVLKVQ